MFNPYRLSGFWRRVFFYILITVGLTYSRQSNPKRIHELFMKLWPVKTGYQLKYCGGYLFPEDLGNIDAVFSPGVGPLSDFEYEFAQQGIPCFLADASVDGPAKPHANFFFTEKFVGNQTQGDFINFEEWVSKNYPVGDNAVLQMDIEGGEFESILGCSEALLNRFKVMVFEIHKLNFLITEEGALLGKLFFERILKNFHVQHFHTNNYIRPIHFKGLIYPSDIELTLIRKDLCEEVKPVDSLPHIFDRVSAPHKTDPRYHSQFVDGIILQ